MTPEDLAALHQKVFKTPRAWSAKEFTDLLSSPGTHLIEQQHGFALFRQAGPEVELLTVAVAPDMQRKGIGRHLLKTLLQEAGRLGAEEVILEVADNNAAARALYQTEGFVEAGYRKNYYETPIGQRISAIVMKKAIY